MVGAAFAPTEKSMFLFNNILHLSRRNKNLITYLKQNDKCVVPIKEPDRQDVLFCREKHRAVRQIDKAANLNCNRSQI